jgi:hypothetical protein
MIPDSPTETISVSELTTGDRVIMPMTGEIETVLAPPDNGLVSTSGTGPSSAYMWNAGDPIDVISRATGSYAEEADRG